MLMIASMPPYNIIPDIAMKGCAHAQTLTLNKEIQHRFYALSENNYEEDCTHTPTSTDAFIE
ncbi:hypothetical protein KDH_31800 [Dictyobacter sp. S3.2.2.5]|uniref:Uncharacterized protein n=1 Tax=Dictyobacter halimunensis TaxID=3026934 RepID=A0ABQ6FV24_9CHLR|nr:hypothetical protein KDH_31800 [Dictyobacter sp. S3.2.2.5]